MHLAYSNEWSVFFQRFNHHRSFRTRQCQQKVSTFTIRKVQFFRKIRKNFINFGHIPDSFHKSGYAYTIFGTSAEVACPNGFVRLYRGLIFPFLFGV